MSLDSEMQVLASACIFASTCKKHAMAREGKDPCLATSSLIIILSKHFVDFLFKGLMPIKVTQKYLKLKKLHFLPLGVVV